MVWGDLGGVSDGGSRSEFFQADGDVRKESFALWTSW